MGVVYFSIIPTFEPSRYYKCWIVCFFNITLKNAEEEKALIDALRCRNGNLEISVSKQETIIGEL